MSAPAWTPGPWFLVEDQRSNNPGRGEKTHGLQLLICGKAGIPVISRRGLARPTKLDGAANARLIAAAPDLVEALMALWARAEQTTFSDQFPLECEMARAALLKAGLGS